MKEMKRERPVAACTTRSAQSLASEPEWPNHTRRAPRPGVIRRSSSASATAFSLGNASKLAPAMFSHAAVTARVIAGWPFPRTAGPNEAQRSRSGRPPSSISRQPRPPTSDNGEKRSRAMFAITRASRSRRLSAGPGDVAIGRLTCP